MQHILIDGGLATELEAIGCDLGKDPLWSARVLVQAPDRIKQVHKNFLLAGAHLLITSTYQASIPGLCKHTNCTPPQAEHYMKTAVCIAKSAIEEVTGCKKLRHHLPLIAASIGPYATYLHDASEYTGVYLDSMPSDILCDWYRGQLTVMTDTEADIIAFETIPGLREAEIINHVLKEFPSISGYISFTCKDTKRLSHGETFRQAFYTLKDSPQIFGIGINCTAPQLITPLLTSIQDIQHDKLILVYPNSGEEWRESAWTGIKGVKPLTEYMIEWSNLGYAPSPPNRFLENLLKLSNFHDDSVNLSLVRSLPRYTKHGFTPIALPKREDDRLRIFYTMHELLPLLDSSDMNQIDWVRLAVAIEQFYRDFDGFVILHGTDTMCFTSSALSFMLENLGKTIIITGAQIPLIEPDSDAVSNLYGAIYIAGNYIIPEVS
ncbi:Homocysteine S-methyltransferase 1-like isoform X1 [Oopsacas minuta]|uniref:Homocysteine S-methyltransferase 1-like isoform X1 n=1 Tax=Oopsacas minuta TaxID=111878 RepID=A0AAV7K889_9METZ|nr:Homocysteine S-methyltransferase 1-like isoform X1 [Oopsacas minuta]